MDHYFDWKDMLDSWTVRFAKRKLIGQAKIHWTDVEQQIEHLEQDPIDSWKEMQEKLNKKYLTPTYKDHLMDELSMLH